MSSLNGNKLVIGTMGALWTVVMVFSAVIYAGIDSRLGKIEGTLGEVVKRQQEAAVRRTMQIDLLEKNITTLSQRLDRLERGGKQ